MFDKMSHFQQFWPEKMTARKRSSVGLRNGQTRKLSSPSSTHKFRLKTISNADAKLDMQVNSANCLIWGASRTRMFPTVNSENKSNFVKNFLSKTSSNPLLRPSTSSMTARRQSRPLIGEKESTQAFGRCPASPNFYNFSNAIKSRLQNNATPHSLPKVCSIQVLRPNYKGLICSGNLMTHLNGYIPEPKPIPPKEEAKIQVVKPPSPRIVSKTTAKKNSKKKSNNIPSLEVSEIEDIYDASENSIGFQGEIENLLKHPKPRMKAKKHVHFE